MEVSAAITAQNNFTSALEIPHSRALFNVSIEGTFVATVTVQRSFDGGANWVDVKTFATEAEEVGDHSEQGLLWRVGVKTGDFTSGTVNVRLSL